MTDRAKWVPLYLVVLLLIAGVLSVSGRDAQVAVPAVPPPAEGESRQIPDIAGEWNGSWNDTVYHVAGDLDWTILQDGSNFSADGTIEMNYWGMGYVPGTASGTLSARPGRATLDFTFDAPGVGSGTGTVVNTGGAGGGTVTAPLSYGGFTFVGTVSDTVIRGTFYFLGSPGTGAGTAHLVKNTPVEATSWTRVKAAYRDVE